jgi:hypothetical protein
MQKTALEIVYAAYELIGIKSEHDNNFPAAKADYALTVLQSMLDMWRLDSSLAQNWDAISECTLVPGQDLYMVGPQGDLYTVGDRPEGISKAWVQSANKTYPMQQVTADEYYRAPRTLNNTTTYPFTYFYSTKYPLGEIVMYPAPNTEVSFSIMYSAPIAAPETLAETVSYGPGYIQAIIFNLAQLLAVTYHIDDPKVDAAAAQFKSQIRASRKRMVPGAIIDPAATVRGTAGHNLASTPGAMYDINSNSIRGSF